MRLAVKISASDMKARLLSHFSKMLVREEVCDQEDIDDWNDETIINYGIRSDPTIHSDLKKIDFSRENVTIDEPFDSMSAQQAKDWLGWQTIGDLTFLGCMGGGDWEQPVAFVIYYDGRSFRGYVPTQGNSFDIASKAAIGSAPEGAVPRKFDISAMRADIIKRIQIRS